MRITEQSRRWWLGTMTGSLSMALVDMTVVSVALPTIQRHLEMSQTELQSVGAPFRHDVMRGSPR